jgi:hypothetical protein
MTLIRTDVKTKQRLSRARSIMSQRVGKPITEKVALEWLLNLFDMVESTEKAIAEDAAKATADAQLPPR